MLLVGFAGGALAVVLGFVRGATGDFTAVVWILISISIALFPLALSLHPARLRSAGSQSRSTSVRPRAHSPHAGAAAPIEHFDGVASGPVNERHPWRRRDRRSMAT